MKNRIFVPILFLALVFFGIGNAQAKEESDASCLTACDQIPAAVQAFQKIHSLKTEEDEIDYLLYRIRQVNAQFFRNGVTYNGADSAKFLRWKIGWYYKTHHVKIETDEDFVKKVLQGSEKTGKPYQIIMPDGSRHNAQLVMANEMNALNARANTVPQASVHA
ncbi:MAG TPA: DUF5329 family protein [Verrucomicrobiae bacterium]|jgi:hypothetical protein|nr:DUF5329 family protein [Verrucomicrobiae bacterium]